MKFHARSYLAVSVFLSITLICLYWGNEGFSQNEKAGLMVVADPGFIIYEFTYDFYEYLVFKVQVQNAKGIKYVSGSVTHPYGDGLYRIEKNSTPFIYNSTIQFFPAQINFEFNIADNIPDELTTLFILKPLFGPLRDIPNVIRVGAFQGTYPYKIEWISFAARDQNQNLVPAKLYTKPVTTTTDMGKYFIVKTQGFPLEVKRIAIIALNDVSLFFSIDLKKNSKDTFEYSGFIEGISYGGLPLTFEIILVDGARYVIRDPEIAFTNILSPPSCATVWETYQ